MFFYSPCFAAVQSMGWCQSSTVPGEDVIQTARGTGRASWCWGFPTIYRWGRSLSTPAVRQWGRSGIWLHRLVRVCVYSVGTLKKNIFQLFCLQLALYNLVPERGTGFHKKCIKSKSWSSSHSFVLFWAIKMQSSFGWFMHEIWSRITSLTLCAVWNWQFVTFYL